MNKDKSEHDSLVEQASKAVESLPEPLRTQAKKIILSCPQDEAVKKLKELLGGKR